MPDPRGQIPVACKTRLATLQLQKRTCSIAVIILVARMDFVKLQIADERAKSGPSSEQGDRCFDWSSGIRSGAMRLASSG